MSHLGSGWSAASSPSDAVLLVLCSQPYDPGDHITDFAEFEAGPPDPS